MKILYYKKLIKMDLNMKDQITFNSFIICLLVKKNNFFCMKNGCTFKI